MNAEKKVFSRLFTEDKTELATQKIDLAIIDDVNSLYEKAFDLYDVQSELLKAQAKVKKSKDLFNQSLKKSKEGLELAKKLGDDAFIKLFQKKISNAKEGFKSADSVISTIDKAITLI